MDRIVKCIATAALVVLGGCAFQSAGFGDGDLRASDAPAKPVQYHWTSHDGGISGSLVATLPDATYRGPFMQITHETRRDALAPMWLGWHEGWNDWGYWSMPLYGGYDFDRFTRYYSGKVVANLQSPAHQHMRCRFNLNDPARGMSGGGQGECELSAGRVIDAVIDRG